MDHVVRTLNVVNDVADCSIKITKENLLQSIEHWKSKTLTKKNNLY